MKASLLLCLLLTSCGSSGSQDYSIKLFAVNIDCSFAELVRAGIDAKFHEAGIPLVTDLYCVDWGKSYEFGEASGAVSELEAVYGDGHYLVPKFGTYFDGYQAGNSSISVAVEGRLEDSVSQASHEILHQFGAEHIFSECNLMGYYRLCDNPPILDLTLKEIGL